MSKDIFVLSRRKLLQGSAYSAVLSMAGLSSQAFAGIFDTNACASNISSEHLSCGLRIIQEPQAGKEIVTIINESSSMIMLNAKQPVAVTSRKGELMVNISENETDSANGKIIISEGERISFDLSNPVANTLTMRSEHTVFNRTVAVHQA